MSPRSPRFYSLPYYLRYKIFAGRSAYRLLVAARIGRLD